MKLFFIVLFIACGCREKKISEAQRISDSIELAIKVDTDTIAARPVILDTLYNWPLRENISDNRIKNFCDSCVFDGVNVECWPKHSTCEMYKQLYYKHNHKLK
jgi:hypothetical protein